MDARKAFMLAVAPGAEVDTSSPTREARVSLAHAVGNILLLDETGGVEFRSPAESTAMAMVPRRWLTNGQTARSPSSAAAPATCTRRRSHGRSTWTRGSRSPRF